MDRIRERCRKLRLDMELFEDRTIRSLWVELSLGQSRDVVLAPKDAKRYSRKDSAFLLPDVGCPGFVVSENALRIELSSNTSCFPPIFFNLKGHGVGNIEDHELLINASRYMEISGDDVFSLDETPLDFRNLTPIEERIRIGFPSISNAKGYDHIFLLDEPNEYEPHFAAALIDHARTLLMEVHTNLPALRLYTGNLFSGREIGKGGCIYPVRGGLLLCPISIGDQEFNGKGFVEYRFLGMPMDFPGGVKGR